MFKSIFSKYFAVISSVVLVSFLALGGIQLALASDYWITEKKEGLSQSASYVATVTSKNLKKEPFSTGYYLEEQQISPLFYAITNLSGCDIVLSDRSGEILLCSYADTAALKKGEQLGADVVARLSRLKPNEQVYLAGTLNNLFTRQKFTIGRPVAKNDTMVGYVLVSSSADELTHYLLDNVRIYLLAALGVLIVAFIAAYLLSYRLVRPLREMAAAAHAFGRGDFSRRVQVQGKDEMAHLAEALNSMAVSLSSSENIRRDFVANVSHELKTPMTIIAGFIDGILDGTVPDNKRDEYLRVVSSEVRRLSRLVKAMLDLSRIDSGQLKLSPVSFDLTESVGHALLSFEQKLEEKRVTVTGLEDCPTVPAVGDYDLLGQVVYNLVENAVKFVNDGGEIRFAFRRENGKVFCAIRNTGDGIPAEEMPQIFERFYKSDKSRSRDKTGLGLGLYLVRCILTLHQGEIAVRSVHGEFCEFEFWLPENPLQR